MDYLFHAYTNLGDFLSLTICRSSLFSPPSAIASKHPPWEELHSHLLDLISAKVSLSDRLSLSAVCKSWGSMQEESLSRVHQPPWFVLPHDPGSRELCCLNLCRRSIERLKLPKPLRHAEFIGSTNGWLAFMKLRDYVISEEALLFLFNPVSRQLLKLPSVPKTPCCRYGACDNHMKDGHICNIAISSSQIKESTKVAAIFWDGLELAICKPGDKQWTIFTGNYDVKEYADLMKRLLEDYDNTCYYADILFHDDTLFVVFNVNVHEIGESPHPEHNGIYFLASLKINFINILLGWKAEEDLAACCSKCLLISNELDDENLVGHTYLTVSLQEELLLIVRWVVEDNDEFLSYKTAKGIDIFKLDVEGGGVHFSLSRMKDIGDRVIFLGLNGSRVVDSKEVSGIQGNCTFFLWNWRLEKGEDKDFVYIFRKCGKYNFLSNKVVQSLYENMESCDWLIDLFSPMH